MNIYIYIYIYFAKLKFHKTQNYPKFLIQTSRKGDWSYYNEN